MFIGRASGPKSIWVAERCGANTCLDAATNTIKNVATVMKFDEKGNVAKAFGEGLLIFPHGIHVDRGGFEKTGKFIKSFGTWGSGDGEFDQPHALAFDSRGRLFVGDRNNNRVQIFDQDGKFIDKWYQFSRPSGIYIDKNDNLYVADSASKSVSRSHQDRKRGIRIGSAKDGKVVAFIPDPDENATGTSAAEDVAVDAAGNIYGAEVGPRAVKKYAKKK